MNALPRVSSIIPVLAVDDIRRAIDFYKHLGFREIFSIPDSDGRLVHAHLHYNDCTLFLGQLDISHFPNTPRAEVIRHSRPNERGIGTTLIVQVENVDVIYDRMKREGVTVLSEPADEFYGDRVFFFLDPFGYEWKVSQPITT